MARASVVKGICSNPGCKRRAKTQFECVKCDEPMKACSFHRQAVYRLMQDHLGTKHVAAVETAAELYDREVVAEEKAEAAEAKAIERADRIAASPTLQTLERARRLAIVALIVGGVIGTLVVLTWLRLRHFR